MCTRHADYTATTPAQRGPFAKRIEPVFEQDGRRRRLVGFHGYLNDELVVRYGASYLDVEEALNEAAREILVADADHEADKAAWLQEVA